MAHFQLVPAGKTCPENGLFLDKFGQVFPSAFQLMTHFQIVPRLASLTWVFGV